MQRVLLVIFGLWFVFSGIEGLFLGDIDGLSTIGSVAPSLTFDTSPIYFVVSVLLHLSCGFWFLYLALGKDKN